MRCHLKRLMLVSVGLSLSSCAGLGLPDPFQKQAQAVVVDSYCQVYNPVVVEKGDSAIAAKTSVKRRILANEQTYRAQCPPAK